MSDSFQVVCPACDAANRLPVERDASKARCGRCKQPLFTGRPEAMDAVHFRKQLESSDVPLIVDFWAGWCGPCQMMAPIFERAAAELEPKARFIKIDVDAEPGLAQEFGVRGIPALFLFRDGKVAAHHAGVADMALLRGWADQGAGSRPSRERPA